MKNLSGTYRSTGENSYTNRELAGELRLEQSGDRLAGTYQFSMNFDDGSSVSFELPQQDAAVAGQVFETGQEPALADEIAFLQLTSEMAARRRQDARILIGDQACCLLKLENGNLICTAEGRPSLAIGRFSRI